MEAGGAGAEYGRAVGSATNVIVKSGTNKFHGESRLYADQESGTASTRTTRSSSSASRPGAARLLQAHEIEKDEQRRAVEASIGGPILGQGLVLRRLHRQPTGNSTRRSTATSSTRSVDVESRSRKINFQPSDASTRWRPPTSTRRSSATTRTRRRSTGDADAARPLGRPANLSWNCSMSHEPLPRDQARRPDLEREQAARRSANDINAAILIKQQDPRFPANPRPPARTGRGNNYAVYLDTRRAWHNGWVLDNGFGTNEYPRTRPTSRSPGSPARTTRPSSASTGRR